MSKRLIKPVIMGECCSRDPDHKPDVDKPKGKSTSHKTNATKTKPNTEFLAKSTRKTEGKPLSDGKFSKIQSSEKPPEDYAEDMTNESELPEDYKEGYKVALTHGERPRSSNKGIQSVAFIGKRFVIVDTTYRE